MAYSYYRLGAVERLSALTVGDLRRVLAVLDPELPVRVYFDAVVGVRAGVDGGVFLEDARAQSTGVRAEQMGLNDVVTEHAQPLTVSSLRAALASFADGERLTIAFCGPVYQVEVREFDDGPCVNLEHEGVLFEFDGFHDLADGGTVPPVPAH